MVNVHVHVTESVVVVFRAFLWFVQLDKNAEVWDNQCHTLTQMDGPNWGAP